MSISQTYYIDGSSLETSTGVFLNSQMSVPAQDGYYSNGSVSRRQLGGILLAVQVCPSCLTECGISFNRVADTPLVSLINVDVLSNVGPIIIKFNPNLLISGILVEYDGVYYNQLSSPTYGLLAGSPSNKETYVGEDVSCTLPIVPDSETVPIYKYLDGVWYDTYSSETISITPFQVVTTILSPGECVMVIPKPNTTPSDLSIKITSPCGSSGYDLTVDCPNSIPEFIGSIRFDSPFDVGFCDEISLNNYYFVSVNNSSVVGLYDWVFSDPNAQVPLSDGWYKILPYPAPNDTIEVANGVVVTLTDSSFYCA